MRKLVIYCLMFFISVSAMPIDHEVYIADSNFKDCNILVVPVKVKNFTAVGTISLKLKYDTENLEFLEAALNPVISKAASNSENGIFTLGFFGDAISLADDEVLFEIQFNCLSPGPFSAKFEWLDLPNTGNCEIAGSGGTPVYSASFINGTGIIVPAELKADATFDPVFCENETTTVAVSANGGTPPYSGTGNYEVSAGSYVYAVTDAVGCKDEITITVSQPVPSILHINALEVIPLYPMEVGSAVELTVDFASDNPVDVEVDWGNGAIQTLDKEEDGIFSLNHFYDTPGVYTLNVSITDICNSVFGKI